ncbi:Holliday junction branch migration protein RuvA [Oligoflexaceae bacterium]|nr:Holliday junction branch migration protein RuvA [Oligoflexaceae bacterium]
MIEKISGQFLDSLPKGIVVDVNGVGYGLEVPLSTFHELPAVGGKVELWVHTYVREDAIKLFGFLHYVDRVAFEILIGLNGVGPKVALAILSTLTVEQLKRSIVSEREEILLNVPGIGKRLAEKIFVELKTKIKKLDAAAFNHRSLSNGATRGSIEENGAFDGLVSDEKGKAWAILEDVRSALENLGFKEKAISGVMKKISDSDKVLNFQNTLRHALGELGSHKGDSIADTSKAGTNSDSLPDIF